MESARPTPPSTPWNSLNLCTPKTDPWQCQERETTTNRTNEQLVSKWQEQTQCFKENYSQALSTTTCLMLGTCKSHGSSFSSSGNALLCSSCSSLNFSCTKCNCQQQQRATIIISETRNCNIAAAYWRQINNPGSEFIIIIILPTMCSLTGEPVIVLAEGFAD